MYNTDTCVYVCVGINNGHGSIESVHDKDVTQKERKKESPTNGFFYVAKKKKSMFDPKEMAEDTNLYKKSLTSSVRNRLNNHTR